METLEDYGVRLARDGWNITPVHPNSKAPALTGWNDLTATPELVQKWLAQNLGKHSVGIITEWTPAVDIDCWDRSGVDLMIAECESLIGPTLVRIGQPPKALLVYRTEVPFAKITSAAYRDDFGLPQKLEVLGKGQQFVAIGIHKDTHKPYQWSAPLTDYTPMGLPVMTREHALHLAAVFDDYALGRGWELISKAQEASIIDPDVVELYKLLPRPENVDVPQILSTLVAWREDRAHWLLVMMAMHHQYRGSMDGFELFHDWCAGASRGYEGYADCLNQWESLSADLKNKTAAPYTFRSLIKASKSLQVEIATKANGVAMEQKRLANGTAVHEAAPPLTPDPRTELAGALKRYVFLVDCDSVHDLQRPAHSANIVMRAFLHMLDNQTYPVADKESGETSYKKLAPAWLSHPARKTAETSIYAPDKPRYISGDGWNYINVFTLPQHATDEGHELDSPAFSVFHDHMEYLIPDEVEREWFISWIAFTVSRPATRSKVTPLHISQPHGTGRGWVHALIECMLGDWNCKKTSMGVFSGEGSAGQFQDYMHRSLLVSIEEVRDGGKRFGVDDRVRDRLEAPRLELNLKYGGKATMDVYSNFFLASNHVDAMVISRADRRIQVISGPDYLEPRTYFNRLYLWLKGPGPAQLYHYMHRRDLSGFNWQRSEHFAGRARMIASTTTDTENVFRAWLKAQSDEREFSNNQLLIELAALGLEDCNEKVLTHLLREAAIKHPDRKLIAGVRTQPWVLRKMRDED